MKADYIKTDLAGFPYNAAFPPSPSGYGTEYHGYRTMKNRFSTSLQCRITICRLGTEVHTTT